MPIAAALLAAVILTAFLVKTAPGRGWVSAPRPDRWNNRTVAKFGGLPILLAFSLATLLLSNTRQSFVLFLLTWAMGLVGFVDDIVGVGPKAKLLAQFILAGVAVATGVVYPLTSHFSVNIAFSLFWITGITNSINLLDNMDGLAAGIAIIGLAQVVVLGGLDDITSRLVLCMLAASTGFLVFNLNPARVFMGDVGALSIGFFLACASVKAADHLSSLRSALFVPCIMLFIPIFDTLLVSVTRKVSGRAISLGARDHASHRLVFLGLNERQAVAVLYVIAATAGVTGFLWKSSSGDLGAGIAGLFLIGSALFWIYLAKVQLPASWLSAPESKRVVIPKYFRRAILGIAAIALDGAVISLGLYFAYIMKFERLDGTALRRFLWATALSMAIKLPLLLVFGAYRSGRWSIASHRDAYPIVKTAALAACLLTAASVALPRSKAIEPSIIVYDTIFTCSLLVLCRAFSRIFDELVESRRFLDRTVKMFGWGLLKRSSNDREGLPDDPERPTAVQTTESEHVQRPN